MCPEAGPADGRDAIRISTETRVRHGRGPIRGNAVLDRRVLRIAWIMRRHRGCGADRRVRHVTVTGTGVHVRMSLVHTGVDATGRLIRGEGSGLLLLSTCMHVLMDAVLTLMQRLLRRRGFEASVVVRVAISGWSGGVLLMSQSR